MGNGLWPGTLFARSYDSVCDQDVQRGQDACMTRDSNALDIELLYCRCTDEPSFRSYLRSSASPRNLKKLSMQITLAPLAASRNQTKGPHCCPPSINHVYKTQWVFVNRPAFGIFCGRASESHSRRRPRSFPSDPLTRDCAANTYVKTRKSASKVPLRPLICCVDCLCYYVCTFLLRVSSLLSYVPMGSFFPLYFLGRLYSRPSVFPLDSLKVFGFYYGLLMSGPRIK